MIKHLNLIILKLGACYSITETHVFWISFLAETINLIILVSETLPITMAIIKNKRNSVLSGFNP